MSSNFTFIEAVDREIYDRCLTAERTAYTDPRTSLAHSRMALELAVYWIYNEDPNLTLPYRPDLNLLMKERGFRSQFKNNFYTQIDSIRIVGNLAIHNHKVSEEDSLKIIDHLYYFLRWMASGYREVPVAGLGVFDYDLIPKEGADAISRKRIEEQQKMFYQEIDKIQEKINAKDEAFAQQVKENEILRLQYEELKKSQALNKKAATQEIEKVNPTTEADTRKFFIDILLREAGWDIDAPNIKEFEVNGMPLTDNPSGRGYADYVLWDDNGKPLAVVEAKKTLISATQGENQAELYADCLEEMFGQRPVIYYSNGFETYLLDDCFYKSAREVFGFYTKKELQTIIWRRENRQDIRTMPIDMAITDRPYQMRAIRSVAEHWAGSDSRTGQLIGTNRRALLVLATGTGKTRTAISLSKILLEANWAKRILFLADRISLVKQAKRNFVNLLPDHSTVNLIETKDDTNARIVFSTYKTLMGLIDSSRSEDGRFYGVGHFDLIIIDEAHRSIYNKYQTIFEYFDGLFLGLTATPKGSIDHNTYDVFGLAKDNPTDAYDFDEAVAQKFLSPYKVHDVPVKFLRKGIKYSELSEDDKLRFEDEFLDGRKATGDEHIQKTELDKWLFNKPTAIKALSYFLKHGIKVNGGDEIGKTIIFARTQKHAGFLRDVLLEMDKEQFGNKYVKVITNQTPKAQTFIERFCEDKKDLLPQIAISVDMMDTGIDAPKVVNLIFYKPVKSYSKFWQMIGRGSRLSPDLFGPGEDKKEFLIFDLCQNFEFFDENPEGIETSTQRGITETVLRLKLHLAQYLKESQFDDQPEHRAYRPKLLNELHQEVVLLDDSRFDVRMKIKQVVDYGDGKRERWNHLDHKDIEVIQDSLFPLVKPRKGETALAKFYDRLLYSLMIKRLENEDNSSFVASFSNQIMRVNTLSRKLLKKTSIPAVKDRMRVIKLPLEKPFWLNPGIDHLEHLRQGVRDLIKYIDKEDQPYVTTNFEDELDESKVIIRQPQGFIASETNATGAQEPRFANNYHRLEEIIRENKNHLVIRRIHNGEQITKEELRSLEALLFSTVNKEALEKELGHPVNLVETILLLVGLSQEKVDRAFADFINKYKLDSKQIRFLDTIKSFLTKKGKIDPAKLYESPFAGYHPKAIDGVFSEKQVNRIFQIIGEFNQEKTGN